MRLFVPGLLALLAAACSSPRGTPAELLREGKARYDAGRWKESIDYFRAIEKKHETAPEAEEGTFLLAESYRKAKKGERSFDAYKKFLEHYPASRFAVGAAEGEYALGVDFLEKRIPGFLFLPPDRGFAIPVLEHMQSAFRNHSLADDALLLVGQYQMERKDYDSATETWRKLLAEYPRSEHFLRAEYELARSLWFQVQGPLYDERRALLAYRTYRDFLDNAKRLPDGTVGREKAIAESEKAMESIRSLLAEKQIVIARFYERTDRPGAAVYYYRFCATEYPGTPAAKSSEERLQALGSRG
jgi:outer membrane protein assembly factor BamD (BamD/ComL family)